MVWKKWIILLAALFFCALAPAAPENASAEISFYPSMSLLKFRLKNPGDADAVKVRVVRDGREVSGKTFAVCQNECVESMRLPTLPAGRYEVHFALQKNGRIVRRLQKKFVRKIFPWEGNRLGISHTVYPPFRELRYQNHSLRTVMNRLSFHTSGLYSSVEADGRELLAGNAEFHCRTDGGEVAFKVVTSGFVAQEKDFAVWVSQMQADGFSVENRVKTEYDGCSQFTLTLTPTPGQTPIIRSLHLDILLKSDEIRLFHVISAGSIRSNPAIRVPDGEGVLWKSADHANGTMPGNLHCYLWLGEMARGLAWFCDSTGGMSLDHQRDAQELIRKGNQLILRIHLVNQPLRLDSRRTIVFGMQPSPTKPMPPDWRKPRFLIPPHGGSAYYAGGFAGMSKYPTGNDWEVVDRMVEARKSGKLDAGFVESWLRKYWEDSPRYASIKAHIYSGFKGFMIARPQSPTLIYFEEYAIEPYSPEFATFQDEWGRGDFTLRTWRSKEEITTSEAAAESIRIIPVGSYQDYALWYAKKWFEHGIGLYFDNVYPKMSANCQMNGVIEPCSSIWLMREYHKRVWVLSREMQKSVPWPLQISIHTTNALCIPIDTWTDTVLDLEWGWENGAKPFPAELLEIESTGRQIGAYPHVHYPLLGNSVTHPWDPKRMTGNVAPELVQTEWAMRVIYEILRQNYRGMNFDALDQRLGDFGYPDHCRIFNYWEKDYPLQISSDKVKSILLVKPDEVMLVMASWSENELDATVRLDASLGVKNPVFKVHFPKFGFAVIEKKRSGKSSAPIPRRL